MLMTDERRRISVAPEDLNRVRALYDEGLYLRAYEMTLEFGPLSGWQGTAARVLAGRLAPHLGGIRLGMALHLRAWHDDPTDPEACYYAARAILGRRGPLSAWRFLRRVGSLDEAPAVIQSDWLATHAAALGRLRDFDEAEAWLARADGIAGDRPWLLVERADLYELEDRLDDALAAGRESLALKPWFRPGVQTVAHILQLLDRDREAVELLQEAADRIESSVIVAQLAALEGEMGRHADARASWDRYAALSPLIERDAKCWLAGRRSDAAYGCGDIDAAAALARASASPFFLGVADRLQKPGDNTRRVVLDVRFVRQHHQTCAPATLAAIAGFWGKNTEHLEIAEAICYDGTPDHRERSWAEQGGWVPREFTVTWDAAVALLDRGVPFTLTTVETQSAHLQAVIGYDGRRGTLLIRDPGQPYCGEALAEGLLERYRSVGPRGMALVPCERAGLLDDLELPEAPLYDHLHRLQVALREHNREAAAEAYASLRAAAPEHRLDLLARQLLAHYDADSAGMLAAIEEALRLFPDDANLRINQLACMRVLGRRDARLEVYRELCASPMADPLLCRQYAQELFADARERPAVIRLIRRVLRARPLDAATLALLAATQWEERRLVEAFELYRFATCLQDKDEWLARTYFNAARHLHREDQALRFLHGRFDRFATRSAQPGRTLASALFQLERTEEASGVLDRALTARPSDGALLLFAAETHAAAGEIDRALERLREAETICRRGDWLRAAASLASVQGDLAGAKSLWKQILEAEPAALDANRNVTQLLAETEGRAAALEHLAQACERFPHNYSLHQAWIEWLRADGPDATLPIVRRLLAIHPADAWAHRELALILGRQGRTEEAVAEVQLASLLDPASSAEATVRGQVLEFCGRGSEARDAYREAIRRSIDDDYAIGRLIELCDSRAERLSALRFVADELVRQVTFGDGLLAFADRARGDLEPAELLTTLRHALEARPDLWHAWSALINELVKRGEVEEALELARQAAARFTLLPKIWLDLATVHRARQDQAGEVEALGRALQINPGWGYAARLRAGAYEREGNYTESRAVLERAVAQAPLDAFNHGCLADALWHLGEKEAALERLLHALRLEPGYDWAWNTLPAWANELARPEAPLQLARELTVTRPGDVRSWLNLARRLQSADDRDEQLDALDRAIALEPRRWEAYDQKAEVLATAGRWDDALLACRPSILGERPPCTLRGRAAWVESERGNLAEAIAQMRTIVAEEPDYYWGWQRLADWTRESGSNAQYLEAAEALVRLASDSAIAAGYRGEARLKTGDRQGAREDFQRALERSPDYSFAAFQLFDIELADRDLAAAGRALEALKAHESGEYVLAREVQYAVARHDKKAAAEALARLCRSPGRESEWPLQTADRAFGNAGWTRKVEAIYAAALAESDVNPQVGALWIDRWAARPHWRHPRLLAELLARGEVGSRAAVAYFTHLGKTKAARSISSCMRRHCQALRADPKCWGTVGYALISTQQYRRAVRWLEDWPHRADARPWMLINLVYALRALGRDAEANRVSRRALELESDNTSAYHSLWLALDDLLGGDGDGDDGAGRLEKLDPEGFNTMNKYLFKLASLLSRRSRCAPADWKALRRSTSRELRAIGKGCLLPADGYPAVLHTYRRAVRLMARDRGVFLGWIWTLWQHLDPPRKSQ